MKNSIKKPRIKTLLLSASSNYTTVKTYAIKLPIYFLMFVALLGTAQDDRFTIGLSTEIGAYSDGFNFGGDIAYHIGNSPMYVKAQFFSFPALNGASYIDFEGTLLGVNFRQEPFDEDRIYLGAKAGLIKRYGYTYPKIGFEIGYEHYFASRTNTPFYVGFEVSQDFRADGKGFDSDLPNYWRMNGKLKFGIVL